MFSESLGISLGGMVAQQVRLAAPERLRTLTLAVTHGGVGEAGRVRGRLLGSMAQHLPREDSVDNLLYLCYTEAFSENPELYALMKNALLDTLAALIPGAKLTVLARTGHGAMWESGVEFNAAVTEFITATPSEAVR